MLLPMKTSQTHETESSECKEDDDKLSSNEKNILSQFVNYLQYYLNIHHFLNNIFTTALFL